MALAEDMAGQPKRDPQRHHLSRDGAHNGTLQNLASMDPRVPVRVGWSTLQLARGSLPAWILQHILL